MVIHWRAMVHITYDYRKDRVSATHDRFASILDNAIENPPRVEPDETHEQK